MFSIISHFYSQLTTMFMAFFFKSYTDWMHITYRMLVWLRWWIMERFRKEWLFNASQIHKVQLCCFQVHYQNRFLCTEEIMHKVAVMLPSKILFPFRIWCCVFMSFNFLFVYASKIRKYVMVISADRDPNDFVHVYTNPKTMHVRFSGH